MYQYKPAAKTATKAPVEQPKTQPQSKKQLSKQTLRMFESVFCIIGFIVKQNINSKVKHTFQKVKKYTSLKKKYSEFLAKKIDHLAKGKAKSYLKQAFNSLINVKISFYNEKMQATNKLKQSSKSGSVAAIGTIMQKLEKTKKKNYFDQLRRKSQFNFKAKNFKTTHIFARLSFVYRNKLRETFSKIFSASVNKMKKARVCQKLYNFFLIKNKRNLLSIFSLLRLNCYKLKLKEIEKSQQEQPEEKKVQKTVAANPTNEKKVPSQITVKKMETQKKQLEDKTNKLQKQLKDLQAANNKSLNTLRSELTKLQKENQSLKFNNDLLDQNNKELQKQLAQRQKKSRKKLNKNQIWENVYNNLIYFLSINRDKTIAKQQLIECLETPLVPCGISLDELREENSVLQDLLNEYKNSFPQPEKKLEQPILPYDILRKKNRYYYQVLQVLSEWGTSGTKQLDKLNADLVNLQKKMAQ